MHDREYYENTNCRLNEIKTWFTDELNKIPLVRAFQSCSNFVAVRIENLDMQELKGVLRENNILIRLFSDKDEAIARIAIADWETMEKTVQIIKELVEKRG